MKKLFEKIKNIKNWRKLDGIKNWLKKVKDVKNWQKRTKITTIIVLIAIIACTVLAVLEPTQEDMEAKSSKYMQRMIDRDKTAENKRVTITYSDMGIINFISFSTSGANGVKESYVGFAGQIHKADSGAWEVTGQLVNYTYNMLGINQSILHGAKLTIVLTVLSVFLGVLWGIILALGKISKNPILRYTSSGYIFFFRGTPLLIQLFVIYYAIPGIFGFNWRTLFDGSEEAVMKGSFMCAVIAFTLNSGAYCAEIVRAAIQSIDKGQSEAAKALGMSYGQTMKKIIIPQSVRRMIPPICNEFIMVLKDASIVFAISLIDITSYSKEVMAHGSYLVCVPALVIYLIITAFFTYIFNKIEKKFSVYE